MSEIPTDIIEETKFRILTAAKWGDLWEEQLMTGKDEDKFNVIGFEIVSINRRCFPDEGEAVIVYKYGQINNRLFETPGQGDIISTDADDQKAAVDGVPWDPQSASFSPPDLKGHEIRIQQQVADNGDDGDWETVFWGQVVSPVDEAWPGAEVPAGDFMYYCRDGSYRMNFWYLEHHQAFIGSERVPRNGDDSVIDDGSVQSVGNPGYNITGSGRKLGNRDAEDAAGNGYASHTWPGAGSLWTDEEVIDHMFASAVRPEDGPEFTISGAVDYLSGDSVVPVARDEPVRDVLMRILDRKRGRGLAFVTWSETGHSDPADFSPFIQINPQTLDDTNFTTVDGTDYEFPGATTAATDVAVDLINDQRLGQEGASTFRINDDGVTGFEKLVTYGEDIQVMATVSFHDDTLERRWTGQEETEYLALEAEADNANVARYNHVFRLAGIPQVFNFVTTQLNIEMFDDANPHRIDYRLVAGESAAITQPLYETDPYDTSPLMTTLAPLLCIYPGVDYSGTPTKYDGDFESDPGAMPFQSWRRLGAFDDNTWENISLTERVQAKRSGNNGMALEIRGSEQAGRLLDPEVQGGDQGAVDRLAFTVNFILPYRLELTSLKSGVDEEDVTKIKRIKINNLALHLADPNAIWGLDETNGGIKNGFEALQGAGAGVVAEDFGAAQGLDIVDNDTIRVDEDEAAKFDGNSITVNGNQYAVDDAFYTPGPNQTTIELADPLTDTDKLATIITANAKVGVIRDDRPELQVKHQLAKIWYLEDRHSCTWSLRCQGMTGTDPNGTLYPKLGEYVTTMAFGGRTQAINTPITQLSYDNGTGVTTWATSWAERDFNA